MKKYIGLLLATLFIVSCESLEDTYKEYAGDGPIRYIGKCTDIEVKPGWNRLTVSWTNSPDPIIDKILITWSKDNDLHESILDRSVSEYDITDVDDGNYEITVCSVDKDGNTSLKSTVYGRPYTPSHEMVQSFTRVVSNHYFIKDRLVLLFQGWEDNVTEAHLAYTKSDGTPGYLELDRKLVDRLYYLLPDAIDPSKPVELYRTGHIVGCNDEIVFEPSSLENVRLFNADFKQEMKRQFGFDEDIPDSWADSVEEISFDRTIGNLSDLLYLPNLKKVILGKHRYIRDEMIDDVLKSQSKIYDPALSDFVLATLHELNPDFIVERYNKHYSTLALGSYIREMGQTIEPEKEYIDLSGMRFVSDPEDTGGYLSYLENLTDDDVDTSWEPAATREMTTYNLSINLGQVRILHGLKLVQTYFTNINKRSWCPSMIRVFVSNDNETWHIPTYVEEIELGDSTGEINIVPFVSEGVSAQYVKISVTTPHSESIYGISIAELGIY